MRLKHFKDYFCETWLEKGIIHHVYAPNSLITLEVAKEITFQRISLSEGIARPVFVDARETSYLDKDARHYWSRGEGAKFIAASAFLIKNNMQRLLLNAFLMINRPPFPSKIFQEKEEALEWLSYFKNLN